MFKWFESANKLYHFKRSLNSIKGEKAPVSPWEEQELGAGPKRGGVEQPRVEPVKREERTGVEFWPAWVPFQVLIRSGFLWWWFALLTWVKTKKWSFEMISVHSGNTEKGISIFLIRTQLVSEEDSPTKMSDARWNPQLWFIFLPKIKSDDHIFWQRQNHQMGRTGIRSTRSRSPKEGANRSRPSTLAGSLLEYTP